MKKIIITLVLFLVTSQVYADLIHELAMLTGYTINGSKTISGWVQDDKSGDAFEGCDYRRKIIFSDNTTLTCAEYSYSYSYRPTAVILSNGSFFKMIVGNETYDMQR